jgi:hypothetical protein
MPKWPRSTSPVPISTEIGTTPYHLHQIVCLFSDEPLGEPVDVQSRSIAIVIRLFVGLGIALAAFWITLQVLGNPERTVIHVTEATYGMNCARFAVPLGHQNWVSKGNATKKIADICEGGRKRCGFTVDVVELGDPAVECGKDFSVSWRCGKSEVAHRAEIAAEANGQLVLLTCP